MSVNYLYGTGRRRTSVARVRLLPGDGGMVVNGKPAEEYFGGEAKVTPIRLPFRVTETEGRYAASVLVAGGGVSGQARGHSPRHRAGALGRPPRFSRHAARSRTPDSRSAGQGAEEVRPEAGSQGPAVHEALMRQLPDRSGGAREGL